MTPNRTTLKEQQILDFLESYQDEHNGRTPTHREIAAAVGTTINAARNILDRMGRKQLIRREGAHGRQRRIIVLAQPEQVAPPVVSPSLAPPPASAPAPAFAEHYTPPATLSGAQQAARHFEHASRLHLAEISQLRGEIAKLKQRAPESANQELRRLRLENAQLRAELEIARHSLRDAVGQLATYARLVPPPRDRVAAGLAV
jgi:DNA-binding Lrp family transcriptional regulator